MAQRWWPLHLVLMAGATYLLLIFLKFRCVLDLTTTDLVTTDAAFSSPSSSDHLAPLAGSTSGGGNDNTTLF
ncbi:hypothetical protein E2562_035639 [Oryza meyeriana var. granulata]|uniref:Uncharacterized protein n=1 Tax=Oryza meyeriana var. granulata TaxID=110450 RepID=A0A6G1E6W9_9ORYZ|nr:hypothetical protein E2562_035639 [Oryza meyeriana var. granulata]